MPKLESKMPCKSKKQTEEVILPLQAMLEM